mmetsp:Transcript_39697/g.77694  ORF Transcript_39697/g.77694 Transcript_39697/m.77694 type:complete len:249 (+) Transcript_39697:211-957(+)|eukprot:CAMPEP_0173390232 /NCGR_PEP_ID=MMETSP1356-20130122/14367_1 /TAXON_ID=77927 ORGANISM="Hemiselmis virescens, Strain PCC157" /NCGR_SAMPLE_ID=MMETSP1356 /ASSEMBLY_ACC=CAM_ASM_000847 /LENGTH=248 /DNA_ID=CAMNT_0014347565 /DNA_START=243 /DNA_END=989 /DNA_ORIENTATION=+
MSSPNTGYGTKLLARASASIRSVKSPTLTSLFSKRGQESESDEAVSSLLNQGYSCLEEAGHEEEALARLEEGLAMVRRVHPEKTALEGKFLECIGSVYRDQGKLKEALAMFKKALRIYSATIGPESAEAAGALGCMAHVRGLQGNFDKAIKRCGEALAIRRRTLGDGHVLVAETLYNMAVSKEQAGDQDGASEHLREARSIYEKIGAPNEDRGFAQAAAAMLERLEGPKASRARIWSLTPSLTPSTGG